MLKALRSMGQIVVGAPEKLAVGALQAFTVMYAALLIVLVPEELEAVNVTE